MILCIKIYSKTQQILINFVEGATRPNSKSLAPPPGISCIRPCTNSCLIIVLNVKKILYAIGNGITLRHIKILEMYLIERKFTD